RKERLPPREDEDRPQDEDRVRTNPARDRTYSSLQRNKERTIKQSVYGWVPCAADGVKDKNFILPAGVSILISSPSLVVSKCVIFVHCALGVLLHEHDPTVPIVQRYISCA
ncbi:unnamed protein product, partial [Ectocarpus sp. 12 AP-2014]